MASFGVMFTSPALKNIMQCAVCWTPQKSSSFVVCQECRCVVCNACANVLKQSHPVKCPQSCITTFVSDPSLNTVFDALNTTLERDGRPLDCEGGHKYLNANRHNDDKYQTAKKAFENKATVDASRICDIKEEAALFHCRIQRILQDQALKKKIASTIKSNGEKFSRVAAKIELSNTEEDANRIVRTTSYFSTSADCIVIDIEDRLPAFIPAIKEVAYVLAVSKFEDLHEGHVGHQGNMNNCKRCFNGLTLFYKRFQPLLFKTLGSALLQFQKVSVVHDEPEEQLLTSVQIAYLKFCCYLQAILCEDEDDDLSFLFRLIYDCSGCAKPNSISEICTMLHDLSHGVDVSSDTESDDELPDLAPPNPKRPRRV